jgi:pSer/pThr/pTyr-binding forkhead associated (FHA) protein
MAPLLEFFRGQREPFPIDGPEVYIGRGASCALRIDTAAAADRHARLTTDAAGNVFIQDLDTHSGTLRNGNFVYGLQQLVDGDHIEIGGLMLVFRKQTVASAAAPSARAAPNAATRLPTELPPEVQALLAARQQQPAKPAPKPQPQSPPPAAHQPPPPVEAAPAGVIVGAPEPEPDNFRTVQMAPADLAALGIDPASLPATTAPAKRTIMGMAPPVQPGGKVQAPSSSGVGYAVTAEIEAPKLPTAKSPATPVSASKLTPAQATMMAQGPTLPGTQKAAAQPPPQKPPAQQSTMMGLLPAVPAKAGAAVPPPSVSPSMKTAQMEAVPPPSPVSPAMKTAQLEVPVVPMTPPPAAPPRPAAARRPPQPQGAYTPPKKGAFGSFSRALAFMGQIFSLAGQHKSLFKPLLWDVLLTTPIMAGFTVLQYFVNSEKLFYALLGAEAFLLYFVDYACNSITASLIYDYATTGEASMKTAGPRVRKALPGVLTFAAVSALLDVASTYARERKDLISRIILRILRAIWTTATYVIMPALVIEGVSFGAAFKRSKALMDQDPTGVGAGIVAMSITSYLIAAVCFPLAYVVLRAGAHIHVAVGALGAMIVVNLYWAVSGWMKIAYATCFYMWARECERTGSQDHALAPLPLRTALDAA